MLRKPAVANQFYSGSPDTLRQDIQNFIPSPLPDQSSTLAVISPHAGYIYSGAVAAETFSHVKIPQTSVILGPNHRGNGKNAAVMECGDWEMPFGKVPIESTLAEKLINESSLLESDTAAHMYEHSLEVQVPFLQYFTKPSIVPICLSQLSYDNCLEIGTSIAAVCSRLTIAPLLIASTDMTHYESRQIATQKDYLALDCIKSLDPEGLYNTVVHNQISMCGFIPTTVTLIAAKKLGAKSAQLIRYTDSGEVSGDTTKVVGYAGFIIT